MPDQDSAIDYVDALSQRLQDYGAELERGTIPSLKSSLMGLRSSYESLLGLLSKKGLLADDPYQYSEKISEISPIPTDPFLENQRATVASIRLHQFETQLAFLTDTYLLSVDTLSLAHLKALTQLLRFVRWESVTETHGEVNTKLMAELVGRLRKGEDTVTAGLVNDMVHQLALQVSKAFEAIKKVTVYQREQYKLMLRKSFWSSLNLSGEEVQGNLENVQRKVRREFATHLKGQPYVQELIKELLDEDFSPTASTLREEVLHKLQTTKAVQEKPTVEVDPRVEVMEAVRTLGTANIPLDSAIRKLHDTAALLATSNLTLGERFQRWLRKLMGVKTKARLIQIEVMDPSTGAIRKEALDFDAFQVEVSGRIRALSALSNRHGPQFIALGQKSEDEILAWFERQFIDLAKTVERVAGLDIYFKTEVPKDKRSLVKGTKAEVAQIRTTMGNANKQRHEAMARREEQEQLRRLGIKGN